MRFVLDATAIRSGISISGQYEWFTTPSVMDEIQKGKIARDIEMLKDISLNISCPKEENVKSVKEAAETTGDISRLSDTDIELLALALELDAIVLTDDYSIQNLARVVNVRYKEGIESGIKEIFEWKHKCTGCARIYDNELPECPICGSKVKMVRKK